MNTEARIFIFYCSSKLISRSCKLFLSRPFEYGRDPHREGWRGGVVGHREATRLGVQSFMEYFEKILIKIEIFLGISFKIL